MDYLDFGSSESENEDDCDMEMACALDSDEEEQYENKRLMKMFNLHEPPTKSQRNIQDFEAEMEAELDRRAHEIETQGGMEHQKSLSRSSSTSSLNKSPRASPVPSSSSRTNIPIKSSLKRAHSTEAQPEGSKSVRFATTPAASAATTGSGITNSGVDNANSANAPNVEKKAKEMYDELYFDSDESDGEGDEEKKQKKKDRRRFLTNDELFYDPLSDDKDQAWMDKQRKKSFGENQSQEKSSTLSSAALNNSSTKDETADAKPNSSMPSTDAVLNCPACFTAVCHDCQRHELYVGQYRAMFVVNCMINTKETLRVPEKTPKKFRKGKSKSTTKLPQFTPTSTSDVFHPVLCKVCRTQVAMYDSDEIYHFFNVLASQP